MIKKQAYGIEIEMTGITRQQAAKAIADYFETEYRRIGGVYDAYEVEDKDGKTWRIVKDGSIQAQKGLEFTTDPTYKVELTSPKLEYAELPKLQEVVRTLRKAGAKVNGSCGIHVHIDAANHTANSLKNLINIMHSKEDLIFKALDVKPGREQYCKKMDENLIKKVSKAKGLTMDKLADIWYSQSNDDRYMHYNSTRYHALNLHSVWFRGTVEFRMFNSTLHAGEVKAYIHLALAISAQAITSKRTQAAKTETTNDKFTFRTWLLRMGLIGDEYKNTRMHLLKNLEGDAAWRYDRSQYACNQRAV